MILAVCPIAFATCSRVPWRSTLGVMRTTKHLSIHTCICMVVHVVVVHVYIYADMNHSLHVWPWIAIIDNKPTCMASLPFRENNSSAGTRCVVYTIILSDPL